MVARLDTAFCCVKQEVRESLNDCSDIEGVRVP